MKNLLLKKWDISKAYTLFLIVYDIVTINLSSIISLMVRFNVPFHMVPSFYAESVMRNMVFNTLITLLLFYMFRMYSSVWRFASFYELRLIAVVVLFSSIANIAIFSIRGIPIFRSYYILYFVFLYIFAVLGRFSYRFLRFTYRAGQHSKATKKVMIIGGGDACDIAIRELTTSPMVYATVKCIIDDDPKKKGSYIRGVRIIGGRELIPSAVKEYDIDLIVIAIPSASKQTISEIATICSEQPCELKILPGVYEIIRGDVEVSRLRTVEIEDLLGRDEIDVKDKVVNDYVRGKRILVTGGGGSIGAELCRQIAANNPANLIIFDIYENTTYELERELLETFPDLPLTVLIGSVRDVARVDDVFSKYRPELVFHAAAHKHVPLMEDSPNEAIKNNVFGTYNVCEASEKYGVDKMILISTDKAVNPTNVMGASKRICEMIVQSFAGKSKTNFAAVRFGNVLGSHGSVIPIFKRQIANGGPVTVTDPNIIRFFMTIKEAVSLVLKAGASANGGEIFVLDMGDPVKIDDLARKMIRLSGFKPDVDIKIEYTGLRPGEKLYEEILMDEEGLEKTDNELIFVGHPIDFDEERLLSNLQELRSRENKNDKGIREFIEEMVPTYHPR